MTNPAPKILRRAFREILENQMQGNDPQETRETYERLVSQGFPEAAVWRLLSTVVATEMFEVLKHGRGFDLARDVDRLKALPKRPFD